MNKHLPIHYSFNIKMCPACILVSHITSSSLLSVVMINTTTKSNVERKGFTVTGNSQSEREARAGAQSRNLKAGIEAETM